METADFTFCVPNLNKLKYLPECINSILSQTHENWRCVFVDGHSTDGSWEYMQQYKNDPRFELYQGLRQGMYADWNECIKHVQTEYFYFLTSDDTCSPNLVEKTVNALEQFKDVDACHFQFALIDENSSILKTHDEVTREKYEIYQPINHQAHLRSGISEFLMHFVYVTIYTTITSLVFRRRLIEKLHGFNTQCGPIGDFDWTMRLCLSTDILYLPYSLATWRIYDEQATQLSSTLEFLERVLVVGERNLELYQSKYGDLVHNKKIDRCLLTTELEGHYVSELYKRSLRATNFCDFWANASMTFLKYPLYPLKKILNRLSMGYLFPYQARLNLANQLIEKYDLDWPPEFVDLIPMQC